MSDIDKKAKAAFEAYWSAEGGYETTWEGLLPAHQEQWREAVRAVEAAKPVFPTDPDPAQPFQYGEPSAPV